MKRALFLAGTAAALLAAARLSRKPYDLRGKVALITGSSRGLGLILARQLAAEGARLVILARDPAELRRAEEDLADRGAEVLAVVCDVADPQQVERTVAQAVERYGRLDVLINNASLIVVGPLEEMQLEDYHQQMNVNFFGTLHFMQAARGIMKSQGGGRIVNISSIGGKAAVPHLGPYTASKFAVTGLSETWRAELLKDDIIVTTIYPNLMRTGSPRNAMFKGQHELEYAWFALGDNIPGISQNAEGAARSIIAALKAGQAELVTAWPAKLLAFAHGVWPGQTTNLMGLVARVLPGPGGVGSQSRRGYESESGLTRSLATKERAEVAYNQR